MTIRHRLNRLEQRIKPEERTTFHVHMPGVTGTEEEIEAELAEAEARGERVYRVRFPSPRDEPCD